MALDETSSATYPAQFDDSICQHFHEGVVSLSLLAQVYPQIIGAVWFFSSLRKRGFAPPGSSGPSNTSPSLAEAGILSVWPVARYV
jgi:hypothetical protein